MPSIIEEQIKAIGVAEVLVVLKLAPPSIAATAAGFSGGGVSLTAANVPSLVGMDSYFTQSELSQSHALVMAGMSNVSAMSRVGARSSASPRRVKTPPAVLHFPNLGVMLGTVNREGLAGLRADERVESVKATQQPSLIRPVAVAAASLTTKTTWGIEFLQIPKLWNQGLTGKGVRVGHLDTGVDGKHAALKTAIASFAEFDSLGAQIKPAPKPHDSDEHGTHTAATIAGRAVSNRAVGVAPEAKLASAIVIEGGNVVARILGGMDWAITQDVRILSMSLGLRGMLDFFLAVTQIIRARNILPVFAVGNEGVATSRSPGNYVEALSVGANDNKGRVPDFSSSQRFIRPSDPLVPDLVAPGVDVISAKPGGGTQKMSGSSMATPHVAGLAALLFQAKPSASVAEVENAIFRSCRPTASAPERGNRGIPNAVKALAELTGTVLGGATKGKVVSTTKKSGKKSAAGKSSQAKTSGKRKSTTKKARKK